MQLCSVRSNFSVLVRVQKISLAMLQPHWGIIKALLSVNQSINQSIYFNLHHYTLWYKQLLWYTYMTQIGVVPKIINICLVVQPINRNIQTSTCINTSPHHTIRAHNRRLYMTCSIYKDDSSEARDNYTISFQDYQ